MSETFSCPGDAPAYALGALDDAELAAFTRHLRACSVCREEVESFEALVHVLPMSVPQYQAPRGLRRAVMAEVRADARTRRAAARPPVTARTPLTRPSLPGFRAGWVGAAVAVVLVLAVITVGLTAGGTRHIGARMYAASVGSGEVILSRSDNQLVVHHLAPLGPGRTYEVWLKRATGSPQPTSVLFNVSASGDGAVDLPSGLGGVTEVMVTQEPAGGTARPTSQPVLITHLS
ncbi:anti-sigma factor domain-containing protein [Conexibacter sp. DBS9H8]|uniref:anti-sigma factor n=1 Tax=Conexibacter sp. DBS9H8 TaxID=2937801 RepID=UPI00201041D0|nr:anti-sigma factor [Conexibacter sp. DBS9H8]